MTATSLAGALLTAILAATAIVHALWGVGSSFPAASRDSLALLAIGQRQMPTPIACFVVAAGVAAMAAVASVALRWIELPGPLIQLAEVGCWAGAAIFALRGIAGYLPAFDRVFPLEPIHTMNRIAYSPLCLLLAVLFVVVARAR